MFFDTMPIFFVYLIIVISYICTGLVTYMSYVNPLWEMKNTTEEFNKHILFNLFWPLWLYSLIIQCMSKYINEKENK